MAESIHLLDLTADEVRERMAAGWDTVVQSFGSTEGHLAHLPLGTDVYQGAAVAERVARALGKAFVAPTIPIGVAERSLRFPGSISVNADVLRDLVYDCCRSFAVGGFRRVVLIVAHLGNVGPLGEAAARARVDFPSLTIVCEASHDAFLAPIEAVAEELGVGQAAIKHAGHAESSIMLRLHPDLVHLEREPSEPPHSTLQATTADYRGASAAAGDRYFARWVDAIVTAVDTATAS